MADCRDNPRCRGDQFRRTSFSWLAHLPNVVNTGKGPTVPEHFWNDAKSPMRLSRPNSHDEVGLWEEMVGLE